MLMFLKDSSEQEHSGHKHDAQHGEECVMQDSMPGLWVGTKGWIRCENQSHHGKTGQHQQSCSKFFLESQFYSIGEECHHRPAQEKIDCHQPAVGPHCKTAGPIDHIAKRVPSDGAHESGLCKR